MQIPERSPFVYSHKLEIFAEAELRYGIVLCDHGHLEGGEEGEERVAGE